MRKKKDPIDLSGGCQCGAVRFRAAGVPHWVANCHCSLCRKQTSAAYASWLSMPTDAVTFTKGEAKIYTDSPDRHRAFCAECGTQLMGLSPKWPEEKHILVGCLDEPNAVRPVLHAYYGDALDWVRPHEDGLPRYATLKHEGPALED